MNWTYGVTTVPERKHTVKTTLTSLAAAGFDAPFVFVDGTYSNFLMDYLSSNVVWRTPRIGAWGNWFLGLWELWLRNPDADRFAMFQDDILCVKNLRDYLDRVWPSGNYVRGNDSLLPYKRVRNCYINLYTSLNNEQVVAGTCVGTWHESSEIGGRNDERLQTGRGALALIFDRAGVEVILSSSWTRRKHLSTSPRHQKANINGGVINTMNTTGVR